LIDQVTWWRKKLQDLIVHRDDALLDEHARRELEELAGLPERSRRRLLETLAAWLEFPGRPTEVARRLHIHPQTARYRLRRLRELLGDIEDAERRFALSLAIRAPAAGVGGSEAAPVSVARRGAPRP
jgi:DNA-binding PucR family transcriptional regulator